MSALALLIAYCVLVGALATALCAWLGVLMVLDARRIRSGTHALDRAPERPPVAEPGVVWATSPAMPAWTLSTSPGLTVTALHLAPPPADRHEVIDATERFAARRALPDDGLIA